MPSVDAMRQSLPFRSVLITGAEGFVGQVLVPELAVRLAPDARLTLCARTVPQGSADPRRIALDLTDDKAVCRAIVDTAPDLVVHLAGLSSVAQSIDQAAASWRVNFGGTFHLAQHLAHHAPHASFFFVSSAEVYGRAFNEGVAGERALPQPQSAYARAKAAAETMLGDVLAPSNRLIVVRPSNHSGPGQDARFVLPNWAEQIARFERAGEPQSIKVGNVAVERDFLDVRDVASAYLGLLDAWPKLPERATFNVASGTARSLASLLDILIAHSTVDLVVETDPARLRPVDVPVASLDITALREATGWAPAHDVSSMLGDILAAKRLALTPEAVKAT